MLGVRQPGLRWNATATGTDAGVTITRTAVAGKRHVITDFDADTDNAATIQIKSDTMVVWQINLPAGGGRITRTLNTPIVGAKGKAVSLVVSASTAACSANMSGVTVRN